MTMHSNKVSEDPPPESASNRFAEILWLCTYISLGRLPLCQSARVSGFFRENSGESGCKNLDGTRTFGLHPN